MGDGVQANYSNQWQYGIDLIQRRHNTWSESVAAALQLRARKIKINALTSKALQQILHF